MEAKKYKRIGWAVFVGDFDMRHYKEDEVEKAQEWVEKNKYDYKDPNIVFFTALYVEVPHA